MLSSAYLHLLFIIILSHKISKSKVALVEWDLSRTSFSL